MIRRRSDSSITWRSSHHQDLYAALDTSAPTSTLRDRVICSAPQSTREDPMTTAATPDLDAIRDRGRATQHARSVPLLVIGALLVNYAVVNFAPQPGAWRYGAPLAFLVIWGLGKANEIRVGVGTGRADYLVAAGAVFIATNLLLLDTSLREGVNVHQLFGSWVVIVGLALVALSFPMHDRVLLVAGVGVVAAGLVLAAFGPTDGSLFIPGPNSVGHVWTLWLLALVGAALGIAGLLLYRRERDLA